MSATAETALALVLLVVGFALSASPAGQALSDAVAGALAAAAAPVLYLFEPDILRQGTELRSPAGWAIRVSAVCDGHGLAISLAAGLTALRGGLRRLLLGLAAIQLFNLTRIIVLALLLAQAPETFDTVHAVVFPFLTVALLTFCLLPATQASRLLMLALPLIALWLPFANALSIPLAKAADLLLSVIPAPEIGTLSERASGWSVGTNLLASIDNGKISLFISPLRPADFALGVPVILAAVLLSSRPGWLLPTAVSLLLALTAASFTAVWNLADAHAPATLLLPDGSGAWLPVEFSPPAYWQALIRLVQNTLVHFNLLVLPIVIASRPRRRSA